MTGHQAFAAAEYAQRWTGVQAHLLEHRIDAALIMSPETQYWLCGYDTFLGALIPQALILGPGATASTLVVWDADVAIAHRTSTVEDVRTYRFGVDDPARLFADVAAQHVPGLRRIGLDLSARAVPFALGTQLTQALSGLEIVDVAQDLARLRAVKSPAEIDLMRRAGSYGGKGLAAARTHATPGSTELQLAAHVEYAMRSAGSDYCSIPTELGSGPRSLLGHGTPSHRRLEPGDLVHLEVGGVERRYTSVAIETMVVPGAPPSPAARELYDTALACLRSGLAQLRPGVPAAEVEAPALEIIRSAGRGDTFAMRFGYGVGISYPPSWLEPLQITRTSTDVLVPGTTFVLHACLLDDTESIGVLVGGTYVMTHDGYERLAGAGDIALT